MTMNKNILLLKTLLLSTSQSNIYKHCNDKKKKGKITGGYIGVLCLYAMLMGYSFFMCMGYGKVGLIDSAPILCALTISILSFFFTVFKTNGYLFNFKEYDMLMSLPFEPKTVAACKFLYMYIKSLPWYLSISVAMLIGYSMFSDAGVIVYPIWIILSLFVPVIPMLFASFIGFLIAKFSSGFKKTKIVQTILTCAFVILCFTLRFITEKFFRDDKVDETLENISKTTASIGKIYFPARWFSDAIVDTKISSMLLLVGLSAVLFGVLFAIVGRSYRSINSAMKSHAAAKNYRMTTQKKKSLVKAIAFKEFKRFTGSTNYLVNGAMGEVLVTIIGFISLIFGFDKIIGTVAPGAPLTTQMMEPAIPFVIYFFLGMMATTACSPSLEGKNYWIVQSLPIEKKTLYKGKMLFNMYLTVPFMIFATICFCISAQASVTDLILYLILGFTLLCFSTAWGCVCGIKHMRLDWENDIEVIKQGTAVAIYLFPNMFVVMGLVVLSVALGTRMDHRILTVIMIFVSSVLAILSYMRVMSLCRKAS